MLYCDRRLYGVEQWSLEKPRDAAMRIPEAFANNVCFLCVEDIKTQQYVYGGTAFFVSVKEPDHPDMFWYYLVTAKHCIDMTFARYGNLSCRLNKENGGVKFVALPPKDSPKWHFSKDADVAVIEFESSDNTEMLLAVPSDMFLTDDITQREGIGLGDEVFMLGLFRKAYGREKNYPIIRGGMIASMPDELFRKVDDDAESYYKAFLIEVRSIGGLSGSPVFMALKKRGVEMHPPPRGFNAWQHRLLLMGLIRGHWDMTDKDSLPDFADAKQEKLNTGIAIVTPIQEVEKVLMSDELRLSRHADIRKHEEEHAPTLDSGLGSETTFTEQDFEADLRKVSRRVKPYESDEEPK